MSSSSPNKLVILVPMAGRGSRFAKVGYKKPKPLIDVFDRPMVQWVVDNFKAITNEKTQFVFCVLKEHLEDKEYNLKEELEKMAPNCGIVSVDQVTEGTACTVLLAKQYFNDPNTELIIANSDQYLEWDEKEFYDTMHKSKEIEGGISTFYHPERETKWSFAKLNDKGFVTEVQEKVPISDLATTGIYYWRKGNDFVKYTEQMIAKNIRVSGEFYTCPVYNEAIQDGKKIVISNCKKMWGLGVPDDLNFFLANWGKK